MRSEDEIRQKRENLYRAYHDLSEEMESGDKGAKPARDIINTKLSLLEWVLGDEQ